ncbi:MAG: hypothetical protein RLY21_906 [Planctomycetota bacterium]|jgi:hypothetical protein
MSAPHPLFRPKDEPACSRCGFSLRGLHGSGRCPECGEAYDDRSLATTSPTRTRAVVYVLLPVACGLVVGATTLLIVRGNDIFFDRAEYFLFAAVRYAGPSVFPTAAWSSWRALNTIDAYQNAQPPAERERPLSVALGCAGAGIATLIGALAIGGLTVLALLSFLALGLLFAPLRG